MSLIKLFGWVDNVGAALGILTNGLLMFTIAKIWRRTNLRAFSSLVLASSIFDTFFCVVELITQHQLLVRRGVVFLMPHGIESVLPEWSYYVFMIPHIFSCTHAVLILGPQYKYRCDIVTGNAPTIKRLLMYVAVSSAASLFVGISAAIGIFQAKTRGKEYYLKQMDGPWFNEDAKKFFLYACDIRDWGTKCFYGGGFVFTSICFWICVYYVYKAYKHVGRGVEISDRTKALQSQFTWSLAIQTLNATIFALSPVSMVCISMILSLDAEFVGMGTMIPLSWLSAANALMTLYIVKVYRRFVLSLLGIRILDEEATSVAKTRVSSLQLPD